MRTTRPIFQSAPWRVAAAAALLIAVTPTSATADDGDERRGRRGPPPEAIEACAAQTEGDACSFQGRRGESLEGLCIAPRENRLVCRPSGAPPHERPNDGG